MNRQFGFYVKQKTAMKNNLIGILDQTYPEANTYFDSPAEAMAVKSGWTSSIHTGMLIVFGICH